MAKRKSSKRTEKTSRTSKSLRVDSSLLTTLIDEIDELVELLRFLPELNILSNFFQERARGSCAICQPNHKCLRVKGISA